LIADLTHMEPGEPGTYARLKEKASHRYAIPGSHRTEVAAETMRGWLRAWRKGGFDALRPKPRADQGQARAIPQEVTDLLCTIKEDKHELSVRMVIEAARASGEVPGELELAPVSWDSAGGAEPNVALDNRRHEDLAGDVRPSESSSGVTYLRRMQGQTLLVACVLLALVSCQADDAGRCRETVVPVGQITARRGTDRTHGQA
jgi:hypothetical protein